MNLDKRQKVILALIVVALVIFAWQLYKLVAPSSSAANVLPKQANVSVAPLSDNVATPAAVSDNTAGMSANQQQYLQLVTEYQMAQIKRLIAEDNEAIAQAVANTTKLGGSSSAGMADYSAQPREVSSSGNYELVYTGQENGEWTATLKKDGQFQDVTAGSQLADNTQVLSVDGNGVTLQQGTVKKLVTFDGITVLDANAAAVAPVPAPAAAPVVAPAPMPAPVETAKPAAKPVASAKPVAEPIAVVNKAAPVKHISAVAATDAAEKSAVAAPSSAGQFYTIQLIADHNLTDVKQFISSNKLKDYKVTILKQGSWYVAIYGQYSTQAAAAAELKDLDKAVHAWGAYVRTMSNAMVQAQTVK